MGGKYSDLELLTRIGKYKCSLLEKWKDINNLILNFESSALRTDSARHEVRNLCGGNFEARRKFLETTPTVDQKDIIAPGQ